MPDHDFTILRVRKLADRSVERLRRVDPESGDTYLINPDTGAREGYPLAGVRFEDGPPAKTSVSQNWLLSAEGEGWAELFAKQTVMRTQGPPDAPVSPDNPPHVFVQASEVLFHTVDGDFRYTVTRSPDKWPDEKDEEAELEPGFGGEVSWIFELELQG
jgi:hypothetical protein